MTNPKKFFREFIKEDLSMFIWTHFNGTMIDMIGIVVGTLLGVLVNTRINKDLSDKILQVLGVCAFLVGVNGCAEVNNPLICILSLVFGGIIGELIRLEDNVRLVLNKTSLLLSRSTMRDESVQAFVSYSLLSIVGAMSVVGPINNALSGDISVLWTKTIIDFVCAILFASGSGISILYSIFVVLIYQGSFGLLAVVLSPVMTEAVITDISAVGSILMAMTGLNILGAVNFKTMNLVPAILLPILLYQIL